MSYRQSDFWTPERTEKFVGLWNEGRLSASSIADVLCASEGRKVSRNAILGKAHRMKLKQRVVKVRAPIARRAPEPKLPVPKLRPRRALVFAPMPRDDLDVPRLRLVNLTDATCRWPVGDPKASGFGFCGLEVADGRSYCAAHYRRSIAGASS